MNCPLCNDRLWVPAPETEEKRKVCSCVKREQLQALYPFVSPDQIRAARPNLTNINRLVSQLCEEPTFEIDKLLFLPKCQEADLKVLLLLFFVQYQVSRYHLLTVNELIDVQFNVHPRWKSIFEINDPVLAILMGFSEAHNKLQMDLIFQLWDKCRLQGQRVLFVARDVSTAQDASLRQYALSRNIPIFDASLPIVAPAPVGRGEFPKLKKVALPS